MTLQDLITLAESRELSKTYPKADGLYIWDYKVVGDSDIELIVSNSGKAGYKDKVSIQELVEYCANELQALHSNVEIVGVEGVTLAKV